MKRAMMSAIILSSLIGSNASAAYVSDLEIRRNVDDIYNHYPQIDRSVDIDVHQGYITLEGNVDDKSLRRQAEDLVENLPGVKGINNRIEIGYDARLKQKVETSIILSTKLDSDLIDVDVDDGVVTLEGHVNNEEARRLATSKAFKAGARDVDNRLSLL